MKLKWNAYYRLMRFHKPAGTLLLWAPTAWALWLANQGQPGIKLILFFLVGTVLMRAAGCVINDLADRNFDRHVARTHSRPLTCGEVSVKEALIIVALLFFLSFLILLQLPWICWIFALVAVVVTIVYPFCKRFIQCPQLVLGVAFSLGIPMAYAASSGLSDTSMIYLLLINYLWILAYDTQYAIADRDDDLRIGIKSTAIFLNKYDKMAITFMQLLFHSLWILLVFEASLNPLFFLGWLIGGMILSHQQQLMVDRDPVKCLHAFSTNSWYGLVMWISLIVAS